MDDVSEDALVDWDRAIICGEVSLGLMFESKLRIRTDRVYMSVNGCCYTTCSIGRAPTRFGPGISEMLIGAGVILSVNTPVWGSWIGLFPGAVHHWRDTVVHWRRGSLRP